MCPVLENKQIITENNLEKKSRILNGFVVLARYKYTTWEDIPNALCKETLIHIHIRLKRSGSARK